MHSTVISSFAVRQTQYGDDLVSLHESQHHQSSVSPNLLSNPTQPWWNHLWYGQFMLEHLISSLANPPSSSSSSSSNSHGSSENNMPEINIKTSFYISWPDISTLEKSSTLCPRHTKHCLLVNGHLNSTVIDGIFRAWQINNGLINPCKLGLWFPSIK